VKRATFILALFLLVMYVALAQQARFACPLSGARTVGVAENLTTVSAAATTAQRLLGVSQSVSESDSVTGTVITGGTAASFCGGAGQLPCSLGWYSIPNTSLASVVPADNVYPEIFGTSGRSGIVQAWTGFVADTKRDWFVSQDAGGHNAYLGNGVYALKLEANPIQWVQLKLTSHGSVVSGVTNCPEGYSDGAPTSRHHYSGQWYLPTPDVYFNTGAGIGACSNGSNQHWYFSPVTLNWTQPAIPDPHPTPAQSGIYPTAGYDSVTDSLYLMEATTGFWKLNYAANTWTNLQSSGIPSNCGTGTNHNSVVDVAGRYFFIADNGSGLCRVSLNSPYTATVLGAPRGCGGGITTATPGLAYDTVRKKVVMWAGGNTIYVYDSRANSCTAETYAGGPAASVNGVMEKFHYFPKLGVFATYTSNDLSGNAYVLRIDSLPATRLSQRCAAPGVIVCEGFDSASEFVPASSPNTSLYPGFDNSYDIVH
jgi:hypothetical protein